MLFMLQDAKPRQTSTLAESIERYFDSWFKIPKVPERTSSVPFEEKMSINEMIGSICETKAIEVRIWCEKWWEPIRSVWSDFVSGVVCWSA